MKEGVVYIYFRVKYLFIAWAGDNVFYFYKVHLTSHIFIALHEAQQVAYARQILKIDIIFAICAPLSHINLVSEIRLSIINPNAEWDHQKCSEPLYIYDLLCDLDFKIGQSLN